MTTLLNIALQYIVVAPPAHKGKEGDTRKKNSQHIAAWYEKKKHQEYMRRGYASIAHAAWYTQTKIK